jgi:broad specificity phosphatase PhoE
MKKYLILVKHSLPEIAENRPASEWRLSNDGQARARRLAERLSEFQPEIIVSSVESKAKGTAEIVANHLKLEYLVVQGLHEHD